MNNIWKIILLIILLSVLAITFKYIFMAENLEDIKSEIIYKNTENENLEVSENLSKKDILNNPKEAEVDNKDNNSTNIDYILDVPFVLQAPFGNWSDPIFQDACEEAAILMVDGWLRGKDFTAQESFDGIMEIVEIEKKELGEHIDASAKDVARILEKVTGSENILVQENITLENIISEISNGKLVIVPTNGRKLLNQFYTPPGPVTHVIVIKGYDSLSREFITNDSGTRNGKDFRYNENILFDAIRDYPTGNHYKNPINESVVKKVMITISK